MNLIKTALLMFILSTQPVNAEEKFSKQTIQFVYNMYDDFSIKPYQSYTLIGNNSPVTECSPFTIDYKQKSITIKGETKSSTFKIITEKFHSQILGKWFEKTSEDGVETTAHINRDKTNYSYDFLEVNHNERSYYRTEASELNTDYFLFNDFIIVDAFDDSYYLYFVTSISENKIDYVDCTGITFSEVRYTGQKHLDTPEGYTKE